MTTHLNNRYTQYSEFCYTHVFQRQLICKVWFMVFNATFNNISVILWRSVLLVEEAGKKLPTCRKSLTNFITYHCIDYTSPWMGFEITTLVVIDTDCTVSCKSNYHMITTMTTRTCKEICVWKKTNCITETRRVITCQLCLVSFVKLLYSVLCLNITLLYIVIDHFI